MPRHSLHPSETNSQKIDRAIISLDFLCREVKTLSNDQKKIRLMLLEIMENTKQYEFPEAPKETPEPVPEKSSWFWSS